MTRRPLIVAMTALWLTIALDTPAAADERAPGPADGLTQIAPCTPSGAGPGSGAARTDPLAAVHALADGDGQRVAVIDTGVSPHPRLADRLIGGGDYLAGGDGLADCDGHGTEVAGLIAAGPDPVTGTGSGVAPAADVLALRQSSSRFTVTGPDGRARPAGEIGTLAAAISRSVALGATVVNVSEVVCVSADRADAAGRPLRDAVREATAAGVVLVAAAGNLDPSGSCTGAPDLLPLPALFDEVIAVGAVQDDDRAADFSVPGPWVDVAAPGVDVGSVAAGTGTAARLSGTSYAAPIVAGVAALLRQRFPTLTPAQVSDRIRGTARRPAAGRDDRVGDGVLDPLAALTAEPLLLRPGADRQTASVAGDGPTAPLPGLGERRPPRSLPPLVGLGIAAALLAATWAVLARLRVGPRPARSDRR